MWPIPLPLKRIPSNASTYQSPSIGFTQLILSRANPIWFPSKLARRGFYPSPAVSPPTPRSLFAAKSVFVWAWESLREFLKTRAGGGITFSFPETFAGNNNNSAWL